MEKTSLDGLLHPPPVCPHGAPLIPLKAAGRPFSLHVEAKKLKQVFNSEGPTVWTKVMMIITLHIQRLFSSLCRASTASVCVCSGFSQMEIVSHHVKVCPSKRKQAKIFRVLFLHSSPHSQTCLGSGRQPVFCGREADEAALSLINAAASPLFPHPRLPPRQRRG